MGTAGFAVLAILIVVSQASAEQTAEEPTCVPGFMSDMMIIKVNRKHLGQGMKLGRVGFTDCTDISRVLFFSVDSRFTIQRDGTLKVNRPVVLHEGHLDILIKLTDMRGHKMTVTVRVVHSGHHHEQQHGHHHEQHHRDHQEHQNGHHHEQQHGHHHDGDHQEHQNGHHHEQQHGHHHDGDHQEHQNGHKHGQPHEHQHGHHHGDHPEHQHGHHHGDHQENHNGSHHGQHHKHKHGHENHQNVEQHHGDKKHQNEQPQLPEEAPTDITESTEEPPVPVLLFPKSSKGLSRRKRDWVIPEISISENDRRQYPIKVSQIRSNEDKSKKIYYSITGPGADQPPVGLFNMDRTTGNLYVTQPLDREFQDKYRFQAYAVAEGAGNAEEPMEVVVNVIDQNDNPPEFNKTTFVGEVPEASKIDYEIIQVGATDKDQEKTDNSDLRYRILDQDPKMPSDDLFIINQLTGWIRVLAGGLDREKYPKYTLRVQVADMRGEGLTSEAKVILTVTDSNDNAPVFAQSTYSTSVEENKADTRIATLAVTDGDEPHSPAWNAKFKIVDGDPGGLFIIKTGTNKQEGIISTTKGLDFEMSAKHTLLVEVENDVPFATSLPTSTATVVVDVVDVNEAPIFDPIVKTVSKQEDLALGADVVQYTASDPDTARKQKVTYKIIRDPAGWLDVNKDTGMIKVKSSMDREALFVKEGKYTALIGAYDNDDVPATGTGTLLIQLEDVNDNAPTIVNRTIRVCNKKTAPQLLSVTDKDGPGFAAPYSVSLDGPSKTNWTARMNETKTGIILNLGTELPTGEYTVVLRVSDNHGMHQESTVQAIVCDCSGEEVACKDITKTAGNDLPVILGILGGILLLLMLVLLLLLLARRRKGEKNVPLLQDDDIRDDIYYYDEEGGGEDDQDFDLGILHRGLDNRPDVFRNDVMPNFMPAPQYRPRPANPDEIGNFIDDNLKAADNDPTAPPYDSLLVFDYEGGGSDAGSLSSLNSTSSGDQDYDCLDEWGPRFKKLADMYGGGEDDML